MFSAAWRADISPARSLWAVDGIQLITSVYSIAEAERNLEAPESRGRLYKLIQKLEIADEPNSEARLPSDVRLPVKDAPILFAAIQAQCTHLVTGDLKHFAHLFERVVEGVRISTLREYLRRRDLKS